MSDKNIKNKNIDELRQKKKIERGFKESNKIFNIDELRKELRLV